MNIKTVILITTLFFISAVKAFAYSDPHDSLIFDGENNIRFTDIKPESPCEIRLVKLKGKAKGTIYVKERAMGCGVGDDSVNVPKEKDQLSEGDLLVEGSELSVFQNSSAEVRITAVSGSGKAGSMVMTIGENSNMTLPLLNELCKAIKEKNPDVEKIDIKKGKLHVHIGDIKEVFQEAEISIGDITETTNEPEINIGEITEVNKSFGFTWGTFKTMHRATKTEFTIEIAVSGSDTVVINKVYEGTVEVSITSPDMTELDSYSAELEQLSKDFQEGKVSTEEFMNKTSELQEKIMTKSAEIENLGKPVSVDAGYKCTAIKNSLIVEPIEPDDFHWWE